VRKNCSRGYEIRILHKEEFFVKIKDSRHGILENAFIEMKSAGSFKIHLL
jgi:hypothetical protein